MVPRMVYVSADCCGSGVEVKDDEGRLVMTWPPEFGLSPHLGADLRTWQHGFDDVFSRCDPPERYAVLGDRFDEAGQRLSERVAQELGDGYQVVYEPQGEWRLASPGPSVKVFVPRRGVTPS
jgi:hypothetical protein